MAYIISANPAPEHLTGRPGEIVDPDGRIGSQVKGDSLKLSDVKEKFGGHGAVVTEGGDGWITVDAPIWMYGATAEEAMRELDRRLIEETDADVIG
jgi:hypothetical protein